MNFSKEEIEQAYKWLKREAYYEKINLFMRKKIAEFEFSSKLNNNKTNTQGIKNSLFDILKEINTIENEENPTFKRWLKSINYYILPKSVEKGKKKPIKEEGKKKPIKEDSFISILSNIRTNEKSYEIDGINYFISLPIELDIIVILWANYVGRILDSKCIKNCLGYRLENIKEICGKEIIPQNTTFSFSLFRYYLTSYNKWRDTAIEIGLQNLKKGNDVLLIAMDIKECFYNIEIKKQDWIDIESAINHYYGTNQKENKAKNNALILNKLIKVLYSTYTKKITGYLRITHYTDDRYKKDGKEYIPKCILPIGIISSEILNNWKLSNLDKKIINKMDPLYYGRYVDDILIVLNQTDSSPFEKGALEDKFSDWFNKKFVDTEILEGKISIQTARRGTKDFRKIKDFDFLYLQDEKLIVHYYNHEGSWAGLKNFQNELEKQASEFRFLPERSTEKELSDDAYEIEYEGSINKLRSVIGVKENHTKLTNYLFEQTLKYWLTDNKLNERSVDQIFRFYKGTNVLNNFNTWERVFALLVGAGEIKNIKDLYCAIEKTIEQLEYKQPEDKQPEDKQLEYKQEKITREIKKGLHSYLKICINTSLNLFSLQEIKKIYDNENKFYFAIKDEKIYQDTRKKEENIIVNIDFKSINNINEDFFIYRKAQLTRHQFISWPLLEFINSTEFHLCKFDIKSIYGEEKNIKTGVNGVDFTFAPRFIHFDDYQLFQIVYKHINKYLDMSHNSVKDEYKKDFIDKNRLQAEIAKRDEKKPKKEEKDNCLQEISIDSENSKTSKEFCIGIVNVKIPEENIKSTIKPQKSFPAGKKQQDDIFHVLNEAICKPKCDLVIFPEASIPIRYIPFMITQSRKKGIGLIFGAEHFTIRKETTTSEETYNLVFAVLPTQLENGYKKAELIVRNKNHYAPEEKRMIESYGLSLPKRKPLYHLITWKGCAFTIYNCYELSDIQQRGIFREKIDLLIGISWNKDVNYYANILESAVRDIHCYAVNVNTSEYGDSRILLPKKTEEKNLVQITGGENCVLLKGILNIQQLRDFQKHDYDPKDDSFKPTPAGFDHEYVRKHRL